MKTVKKYYVGTNSKDRARSIDGCYYNLEKFGSKAEAVKRCYYVFKVVEKIDDKNNACYPEITEA